MDSFPVTERTQVRRLAKRGRYDRETVYSILDAGWICHVGFTVDGRPVVIPTAYGRDGGRLIIHGSAASRMLRTMAGGIEVCVTVTHVDGLVLARSAFHHSINYRSVMLFGRARLIEESEAKNDALRLFTEHLLPGRWAEVRTPNEKELKATTVLELPIEEASAKVRTGPPVDDEEDMSWPVWAGVIPLSIVKGAPEPDPGPLTEAPR